MNIKKRYVAIIVIIALFLIGLVAFQSLLSSKYVGEPRGVPGEYAAIAKVLRAQVGLDTGCIVYILFQDTAAFNAGIGEVSVTAIYDQNAQKFNTIPLTIQSVNCAVLRPDELQKTFGVEGYTTDAEILPIRETPMYSQSSNNGIKLSEKFEPHIVLGRNDMTIGNVALLYSPSFVRLCAYYIENHSGVEMELVYQVVENGVRPRIDITHYVIHGVESSMLRQILSSNEDAGAEHGNNP